ncbi:MAG: 50S ribosomal protein L18 [Phycisphaerales bacterium]|nr:50S ribosomal protein L18 [Phycisphaerales bacterium]
MAKKINVKDKVKFRIRKKISGTKEKPRLTVYRSNVEIYAQLIDDTTGNTLCAASSLEKEVSSKKVTKVEKAKLVGLSIAKKAKVAGIQTCVFDRNGNLYHGRVKSLADGAREAGLLF